MSQLFRALVDLTPSSPPDARRQAMRQATDLFTPTPMRWDDSFPDLAQRMITRAEGTCSQVLFGSHIQIFSSEDLEEFKRYADILNREISIQSDQNIAINSAKMDFAVMLELRLRARTVQKNPGLSPIRVEDALEHAKASCLSCDINYPEDWPEAQQAVKDRLESGLLSAFFLPKLWRDGQTSIFYAAFCHLTELDYPQAVKLLMSQDKTGLAIACRASKFDVSLFKLLASLNGPSPAIDTLADLYPRLPVDLAGRTVRFTKALAAA